MYEFVYQKPISINDAIGALRSAQDGKVMAGGMTLLPTLKQRLARPSHVIDLGGINDLFGIKREGNQLVIGAMTTHAEVENANVVTHSIPGLSALAGMIGDPQVRNRGTLGGSIANADPAADYPAAIVGLNATISTNLRRISADDFFKGLFETALDENELVLSVNFPIPLKSGYAKFPNPASRYAIVGVMVAQTDNGVRVAVTGAGSNVFRLPEMESALTENFSSSAIDGISVSAEDFNEDIHAGAKYRAHLVGVMAKRAVASAR